MGFRGVAPVAAAVWLVSCGAKDDISAMVGDYERPATGSGDRAAELHIGRDGMSATDAPFSESLAFDRITCEDKLRCRVSGSLCSAALEKRPDGNILVSADSACHTLSGLWLSPENAKRAASASVSSAVAGSSSPSASSATASASGGGGASAGTAPLDAASASVRATATSSASASARKEPSSSASASASASAAPSASSSASARPSRDSCMRKCTRTGSECSGGCGFQDDGCVLACEKASIACMQAC